MSTARPERTSSILEESAQTSPKLGSCGQPKSNTSLFESHKLLAYSISNGYAAKLSWLRQDIEQEALLALWEACHRFDVARGAKFSTFAYRTINGRLLDFIKVETRHVIEQRPDDDGRRLTAVPHDEPIPEPDSLASKSDLAKEYNNKASIEAVDSALACLTEREFDVISLLYWGDHSATDVAQTIGISNARVSMVASNARNRLRPILQSVL